MKEYTEEQLNTLKEIKRLFENLDQHPFGLYVPCTNFQKRFAVSADSYYGDAIMLVKKCKNQTSKKRIQSYMRNATEHLKRDLRKILGIIKECEDAEII